MLLVPTGDTEAGTETIRGPTGERLVRLPTRRTHSVGRLTALIGEFRVLNVPRTTFIRRMPRLRKWADAGSVVASLGCELFPMPSAVLLPSDTFEIVGSVVERVMVSMVNEMTGRYRTVVGLPDLDMQRSDAFSPLALDVGPEVDAVGALARFKVSDERDPVELDGFLFHRLIIAVQAIASNTPLGEFNFTTLRHHQLVDAPDHRIQTVRTRTALLGPGATLVDQIVEVLAGHQ
jgi:hypothetical protein